MPHVLSQIGVRAERLVQKYMPDPFVLVLLLTCVALAGGFARMQGAPFVRALDLVEMWTTGFGNPEILKFGLQILLIVVTGEAIASSPPAKRVLGWLTTVPKSARGAILLVSAFALVSGWLHWGFGLVASALLARELGRGLEARGIRIHYPLLGMAAYTSMLLWHAGITASAPLLMNTDKNFVSDVLGEANARVPLSQTVFAPYNLVACAVLALGVPFVLVALRPPPEATRTSAEFELPDASSEPQFEAERGSRTLAERLDRSRALSLTVGLVGLSFLCRHFYRHGFDLNHNVVNCAFLMFGLALHDSPTAYARAIASSVKGTSGIVLQFPFYGGILAVMAKTGLSEAIAHVFIARAGPATLPLWTFIASVLTKSFVPSGAGEWAVEGPVMLKAAKSLGVPYGKITMAVAYGNMLGNMYQPFWSLPLLGLMGLRARDIMGFGLVLFAVCAPVLAAALFF